MIASLIRRGSTPRRIFSTAAGSWRSASRRTGAGCHAARRVTRCMELLACRLSSPGQASPLATHRRRAAREQSTPPLHFSTRSMPTFGETEATRAAWPAACKCSLRRPLLPTGTEATRASSSLAGAPQDARSCLCILSHTTSSCPRKCGQAISNRRD